MISPEKLRRYPFFGVLDEAFVKKIAMLAEEEEFDNAHTIYKNGDAADKIYLLSDGCVESYLMVQDPDNHLHQKHFYLGDINPGDTFGLSGLVEPYLHTTTMRTSQVSRIIKIDATVLRQLIKDHPEQGLVLMHQVAQSALERLKSTRVQLAATRSSFM